MGKGYNYLDLDRDLIFSNPLWWLLFEQLDGVSIPAGYRRMNEQEKALASTVFRDTVPFQRVYICDGAGKDGRPFTLSYDSDYWIISGNDIVDLADLSAHQPDRETLIHELVHVWQGEHSLWNKSYIFNSLWNQARGDAYGYRLEDITAHKPWKDFNVEQQAKIVEDWFAHGQSLDDPRYRYVVEEIRDEILYTPVRSLPHATLNVSVTEPSFDTILLPLLNGRYAAPNSAEAVRKVKGVEDFFKKLDGPQAKGLLARLKTRQNGDKVSASFYDSFNSMTVGKLLIFLRDRVNA